MTYKWKMQGIIPVSAETAGAELERIQNEYGSLNAKQIVDESREDTAPLHPCFEWDDRKAAEKYREDQARKIVNLLVVDGDTMNSAEPVRAYVHVGGSYKQTREVIQIKDARDEMLAKAMEELKWFKHKYSVLAELKPVISEIGKLTKEET